MNDNPWNILYTESALADKSKCAQDNLEPKINRLLLKLKENPYGITYAKKLLGYFEDAYSVKINWHHHLIYQICEKEKAVKIISLWSNVI